MRTINTTDGPKVVPRGEARHINTTDVLEPPQMQYLDEEPDILAVLPGGDWCAVVDGDAIPLVAWVALDDETVHGVALDEGGRASLSNNVENNPNFVRYSRGANINDKEK